MHLSVRFCRHAASSGTVRRFRHVICAGIRIMAVRARREWISIVFMHIPHLPVAAHFYLLQPTKSLWVEESNVQSQPPPGPREIIGGSRGLRGWKGSDRWSTEAQSDLVTDRVPEYLPEPLARVSTQSAANAGLHPRWEDDSVSFFMIGANTEMRESLLLKHSHQSPQSLLAIPYF